MKLQKVVFCCHLSLTYWPISYFSGHGHKLEFYYKSVCKPLNTGSLCFFVFFFHVLDTFVTKKFKHKIYPLPQFWDIHVLDRGRILFAHNSFILMKYVPFYMNLKIVHDESSRAGPASTVYVTILSMNFTNKKLPRSGRFRTVYVIRIQNEISPLQFQCVSLYMEHVSI